MLCATDSARSSGLNSFGPTDANSAVKGEVRMKSIHLTVVFVAILLIVAPACAAGDAAAGKEIYSKKCASCHGIAGEGKESIAKSLKVDLRHLGSKEVQAAPDSELKRIMLQGKGKMKGVAGLDDKAADDIVAYLRTLKK
jgi:mono/diheme cytochrome c family protein